MGLWECDEEDLGTSQLWDVSGRSPGLQAHAPGW